MKSLLRLPLLAFLLTLVVTSLTSCEVIGDIFKAGMWTGIIMIFLVVMLVLWLIRRFR